MAAGFGRRQAFPEVDRAAWFPLDLAERKLVSGQIGFVAELADLLALHDPGRQDAPSPR